MCEFPSSGAEFTWRNGNGLMSKIDRFFGNAELLDLFQMSFVCGLERPFSDHTPLVWDNGEQVVAGSYFKFRRSWLREIGFRDMFASWWRSQQGEGTATSRLASKLMALKGMLKEYGDIVSVLRHQKHHEALLKIQELDTKEAVDHLSELDLADR
jgi:hypothetical protein